MSIPPNKLISQRSFFQGTGNCPPPSASLILLDSTKTQDKDIPNDDPQITLETLVNVRGRILHGSWVRPSPWEIMIREGRKGGREKEKT